MGKRHLEPPTSPRAIIAQLQPGTLSPLQTARALHWAFEFTLERDGEFASRWPQALSDANAEATEQYFLGSDVQLWHSSVREQKRAQLTAAEERWRTPVEEACRGLLVALNKQRASQRRGCFFLSLGIMLVFILVRLLNETLKAN